MLEYATLESTYKLNFSLLQRFQYSLTELENMIPFERDIYMDMLSKYLDEQNKELQKNAQS
jgi:hypothetical protein